MNKKTVNKELFSKRLSKLMEEKNETTYTMANTLSLSAPTISRYMTGQMAAKITTIEAMAKYFNVNPVWLMGYNVSRNLDKQDNNADIITNIFPIEIKKFPLLGEIACGQPIFVNEDRESYILAGSNINADFCLKARGDSMVNARILDGDIVFIRQQPVVNDGEIAAIVIDDTATLKRVYYDKEHNTIQLIAENPAYRPLVYQNDSLDEIKILGKAVAFQSDVI